MRKGVQCSCIRMRDPGSGTGTGASAILYMKQTLLSEASAFGTALPPALQGRYRGLQSAGSIHSGPVAVVGCLEVHHCVGPCSPFFGSLNSHAGVEVLAFCHAPSTRAVSSDYKPATTDSAVHCKHRPAHAHPSASDSTSRGWRPSSPGWRSSE